MSRSLELWLVRHGETVSNADGRLSGWSDVPLSELGQEQARSLAPVLANERFDRIWSSDLERAVATARLAIGEPTTDARLREMDFGRLEGRRWTEIGDAERDAILEFDDYTAPGGESTHSLRARVLEFVAALPPGRHLIFSHGGAIRMLTGAIGHDRFLPNGGLIALDWERRAILFSRESGES
jgi:probable phosphoglycerate mutase